ncbi:MAG: hypothetical protein ACYCSW_07780 [bacterium]
MELIKKAICKNAHTAIDGKTYYAQFYFELLQKIKQLILFQV